MTSRTRPTRGFTLFEVLAAVLILGLFFTVLADQAVRGLRSEGIDRRRTAAADIAVARLVDLETLIAGGAPLEPLQEETEEGDYRVLVEILPEDVEALMPPPPDAVPTEPGEAAGPRLLVDERGDSRLYRVQVVVGWEESGQPHEVRRTTWDFDRSQLALLFPDTGDDTSVAADGVEGQQSEGGDAGSDSGSGTSRSPGGSSGRDNPCANATTIEDMMECLRQVR